MASLRTCRVIAASALVLAALAVSSCGPAFWWTYQNDLQRTGYVRGGIGLSPKFYWDATPGSATTDLTPPAFGAIGDTFRLFIGTGYGDRTLYALHPQTGATLWTFQAPANNGFAGAPAAVDGRVYAATLGSTPEVYALDQAGGSVLWHTPLPATGSRAAVAVAAGRVIVNTDAHRLLSFDATTGAQQWMATTTPGTASQESSPSVFLARVYVGSGDRLFAFDLATGAPVWSYTLPTPPGGAAPVVGFSSPVVATAATPVPLVLIGATDMKVHAVNAFTGAGVWTYPTNVSLANTSVAVADGRVFTLTLTGAIALDLNTGAVLWTQNFGVPLKTPAVGGRRVYYSEGTSVFALDTATGTPQWKAPLPTTAAVAGADMAMALEILIVPNRGTVRAFK